MVGGVIILYCSFAWFAVVRRIAARSTTGSFWKPQEQRRNIWYEGKNLDIINRISSASPSFSPRHASSSSPLSHTSPRPFLLPHHAQVTHIPASPPLFPPRTQSTLTTSACPQARFHQPRPHHGDVNALPILLLKNHAYPPDSPHHPHTQRNN